MITFPINALLHLAAMVFIVTDIAQEVVLVLLRQVQAVVHLLQEEVLVHAMELHMLNIAHIMNLGV